MIRVVARLFLITFVVAAVAYGDATFTFYVKAGPATINRPASLSTLRGELVPYGKVNFFPNEDSTCSIYSTQEGDNFDGVLLLYDGPVSPASPLDNLIAINDDFDPGLGGLDLGTSAIEQVPLTFVNNYYVVVAGYNSGDTGTATVTISCSDPATRVIAANGSLPAYDGRYTELLGGRFRVWATWRNFSSVTGDAYFVPLGSDDSGLMWFFSPQNFEVLIKAINGCALNNRFWIYYAATTNVEFTIYVHDTVSGLTRTYFNPLGTTINISNTDSNAFASCPP